MADLNQLTMGRVEVVAPVGKALLTRDEVKKALATPDAGPLCELAISDTALDRLIAAGRFPEGIRYPRGPMWEPADVAYFLLGCRMATRLRQVELPDTEHEGEDDVTSPPPAPKRPPKVTS